MENKLRQKLLLEILRAQNKVEPTFFEDASEALIHGEDPLQYLFKNDIITRTDIFNAQVEYANSPFIDLDTVEVEGDFSDIFGIELLEQYHFIPIYRFKDGLWLVAAVQPTDPVLLQILRSSLDNHFELLTVEKDKFEAYLKVYAAAQATKTALESIKGSGLSNDPLNDTGSDIANAPAVRFIDSTLEEAVKIGASDIHIEPSERTVLVRYRIDGDLHEQSSFDISSFPSIATRIKILADIDIAEKRIPQDGHITKYIDNEKYDFRVSTLPTIHGEKFVIRVLDKKLFSLSLSELHFSNDVNETIGKMNLPVGVYILSNKDKSFKAEVK